jgi:hypothetical protein
MPNAPNNKNNKRRGVAELVSVSVIRPKDHKVQNLVVANFLFFWKK